MVAAIAWGGKKIPKMILVHYYKGKYPKKFHFKL